jgi:hypothetical protein
MTSPTNVVLYADRGGLDEAFSTYNALPQAIEGSGYAALDRVALSPDRLRLIILSSDRKRFGQVTRVGIDGKFSDTPDEVPFKELNESVGEGEMLGDPILVASDTTLYYSRYGGALTDTVFVATRSGPGEAWVIKGPVIDAALAVSGGKRRRPTGMSSDQLTLFFWDETTDTGRVAWRLNLEAPFEVKTELGARQGAQTTASCFDLYYSSPGVGGTLDIFLGKPD